MEQERNQKKIKVTAAGPGKTQFQGMNKLCGCGSGKKYKLCCEPLTHKLRAKITEIDSSIQKEIKKILIESGYDHKDKNLLIKSRKEDYTEKSDIFYAKDKFDILKVIFTSPRVINDKKEMLHVINSEIKDLISFENLL